jgi:flagellar motility protein MotE (MotC chaperone)
MSRMLMFCSIGVILFSLAAGTSWYLQYRQHQDDVPKVEDEKSAKAKDAKTKDAAVDRPLVRAPLSPDADRLTVMASTLQTQQQALKTREQQLTTREKQLDLIHDEIKKEHKKLESVRKQVDTEMQLVQEKIDLLERKSAEGEKDNQRHVAQVEEAKRVTLELNGMESKNLKQVAGIYDKMDADAAAQSIQQMVDKGKLDTAVTILACMRDRQAANLLGVISSQDATIATQLFDRMRYMKTTPSSPK